MEKGDEIDKLTEILSRNKLMIYGTGSVGMRFLNGLKQHGMLNNILCFVESACNGSRKEIEGIPIRSIEEVNCREEAVICIAVHDALKDEIIQILKQRNFKNYLWVYPLLYEFMIGAPIELDAEIDINKIIDCAEDYRLAIRYLVLEQYWGKGKTGYDIYVRSTALHCGKSTAEKRLKKFCELIHDWSENGMNANSRILLNTKYKIIDGHHRVATAKYFGQEKIKCNIFSCNLSLEELQGRKAVLTEEILRNGGFSEEEIKVIDAKNRYMKGE